LVLLLDELGEVLVPLDELAASEAQDLDPAVVVLEGSQVVALVLLGLEGAPEGHRRLELLRHLAEHVAGCELVTHGSLAYRGIGSITDRPASYPAGHDWARRSA